MSEQQYTTFYLDDMLFGIDIMRVREINPHLDITTVHKVPDYVRGLINLRGRIVTVLDLGVRLGLEPRNIADSSRSIVLKTRDELGQHMDEKKIGESTSNDVVGLLVDRIGDVVSVDSAEVEMPPANMGDINSQYISGVIKLEGELLSIIKINQVCQ